MADSQQIANSNTAKLPQSYSDMQKAIAVCDSVDECKEWADKAAALASYHRQSKDTALMNQFMRIQARAIRRAGEVLETIEPQNLNNLKQNRGTGTDTSVSRTQAAKDAGMSKRQQVTAMKIARIPREEFEELVESYEPPTITYLSTPHVAHNSGENEWYTPPEYIEAAREVMGGIDLDPASSEIANRIVNATAFYSKENSGLNKKWTGRVWMNPPYAQPLVSEFINKIISESNNIESACVLVNNATDTKWLQSLMAASRAICFIAGRVRFLKVDGPTGTPLQGQVVVYMGAKPTLFQNVFGRFGKVYGDFEE